MKRISLTIIALILVIGLVACGNKEPEQKPNSDVITNIFENESTDINTGEEKEFEDPFAGYTSDYLESEEGMIFQTLYHHYRASSDWVEADNDFEIKKVTNPRIKIYTPEEIQANEELFKDHNIKEGDIAFEATVDLEISENATDLMKFTAGTGEIDGHTIKDKYECGFMRKVEDGYELELVGTSF